MIKGSLLQEDITVLKGFPCGSAGKEPACNVGDLGLITGLGWSPGEGKGSPLQYSSLENYKDCIAHGGHKESDTTERLSWMNVYVPNDSVKIHEAKTDQRARKTDESTITAGEANTPLLIIGRYSSRKQWGHGWADQHCPSAGPD